MSLLGLIHFEKSEKVSDNSDKFFGNIFSKFPSRFPLKDLVEIGCTTLAGDYQISQYNNDSSALVQVLSF